MKPTQPEPETGCTGENLRVLAEENEIAAAIERVLFDTPKPQPKKRVSSEPRLAL